MNDNKKAIPIKGKKALMKPTPTPTPAEL